MMADIHDPPRLWQKLVQSLPQPVVRIFEKHIRPQLPDVSFITLHYLYFIATSLLASLIFWGSSTPGRSVSYTDSLFLAISAMTEAGLNTVNLSVLNTWQQVMLFILIMMGSAIFVSIAILHIRKRAFEQKFDDLVRRRNKLRLSKRSLTFSRSKRRDSTTGREGTIMSGAERGLAIKDERERLDDRLAVEQNEQLNGHQQSESPRLHRMDSTAFNSNTISPEPESPHIRFRDNVRPLRDEQSPINLVVRSHSRLFTGGGVGVRGMESHPRNALPKYRKDEDLDHGEEKADARFGAMAQIDRWIERGGGYIGRNSQFHNLSEKDRKKLGGIEYDAICLLSWVVPTYFILWQLFGALGVGAWLQINRPSTALQNGESPTDSSNLRADWYPGLNPFWTGAFFAISAFNNSGMALLDANAVALETSYYALLTLSLLILAGNTCFPPFLRLILWTMKKSIPQSARSSAWEKRRQTLDFILTHPRRVYTNLFPAPQTWWLVSSLVLLNGIDWIAFEVLNIGNPTTEALPGRFRVLDGLFQAFAVRSGGFYVVSITGLYPGLLVLYVLMMYVSALPVSMTIRNTNVYEERSLGIFSDDQSGQEDPARQSTRQPGVIGGIKRILTARSGGSVSQPGQGLASGWSRQDFIRQQLKGQLSHDLWWLALAVLFITIIETGQFKRDPVVFSVFNIIFEVVSGYGCVGISTGVPWNAYSFCGAWHTGSKLILCAVMLRGRHRGLPVAIDKAVLLPDESNGWAEEEDEMMRRRVRRDSVSGNLNLDSFKRSGTGMNSSFEDGVAEVRRRASIDGDAEKGGERGRERERERENDSSHIV